MYIRLSNIHKEFTLGLQKNLILKDISTNFEGGRSYVITGRSGSGKSTLLSIIAGFDQPTYGQVIFGKEIKKESIGFMFQAPYLLSELSVIENIMLPGLLQGMRSQETKKRAQLLLSLLEIEDKYNDLPGILSGGQQQRVAFARALITNPLFLLADEPTSNLDEQTAQMLIKLMKQQQIEQGTGLIICSHDHMILKHMNVSLHLNNGLLENEVII